MIDDLDFVYTMKSLRIDPASVPVFRRDASASIARFRGDLYAAALCLIHGRELSERGQFAWGPAQREVVKRVPAASGFFFDLTFRWAMSGDVRPPAPWSLTDPDFKFCLFLLTVGDMNAGEFERRYLSINPPGRSVSAMREWLIKKTVGFLRRGVPNGEDLPAESFYQSESNRRDHLNLLSAVNWQQMKEGLYLVQKSMPGILEKLYREDEERRKHFARMGLSAYKPIPKQ